MAKSNGTSWKIYVSSTSTAIANIQKISMSLNRAMIDVTTKDSNHWKEVLPGLKDGKFTFEGLLDFVASGFTPVQLQTAWDAGTSLAFILYDTISGDKQYQASGYLNKFDISTGTEDAVTFSLEATITGTVTQANIT
jgi:predicted secreted protein